MNIEEIQKFCLSFAHATEDVKWGNDLVFSVGKKMFTVVSLEQTGHAAMSFKCTPEKFAELIERDGLIPAPYVARYHWVALERFDVLDSSELTELIKQSYQLVWEKLPQKIKKTLTVTV
jgi:predicted DNA-binding protein (MmcQ/YjbR family)